MNEPSLPISHVAKEHGCLCFWVGVRARGLSQMPQVAGLEDSWSCSPWLHYFSGKLQRRQDEALTVLVTEASWTQFS